jgi:hypothetical protein
MELVSQIIVPPKLDMTGTQSCSFHDLHTSQTGVNTLNTLNTAAYIVTKQGEHYNGRSLRN